MERYCYTLKRNGWEEQGRLFFTKEINGEQCIVDLSEWDKRGKQPLRCEYIHNERAACFICYALIRIAS